MLKNTYQILILSLLLVLIPVISHSQTDINIPSALANELNIEVVPNYPRPNEMVYISLSLYTDDLSSADIAWYKDGKLELQGKGRVNYSFRNGLSGKETKVEVRIRLVDGTSFSKSFSFAPASIDIVWESDSHVPPFYKGKALHPRQGNLKIVAMPEFVKDGKTTSPENLIYEWSNDTEVYQSQSGYGKNVLILNGSILGKRENLSVLVTDPKNGIAAEGFVTIVPVDPEVNLYRNDPFYGYMLDTVLPDVFDLKSDEVSLMAIPYYMSRERDGDLIFNWRLNGISIPELKDSTTAVFRKPDNESGQSSLFLRIENSNKILQEGEVRIMINFDE